MDNEKQYTEGIRLEKRHKGGRMENFWYHYKWPVIGVLVFLLIFVICIAQSCSQKKEDISLLYAGPHLLSAQERAQIEEVMTGVMPYDLDGNGEKALALIAYNVYSQGQIEDYLASSPDATFDTARNSEDMKAYQNYIKTGESAVYLLDPWLYELLRDDVNQPLQRLSDVLGEVPKGALEDGYGVRLGDTELYARYQVLGALPPDTVICFSRPYMMGKTSKEKNYLREKEMLAAILGMPLKDEGQ